MVIKLASKLLIAGWKDVSLVDVKGESSFTIWLCGCNLKCPFCHNWKIAEKLEGICRFVDISEILEEISKSCRLVDYVHFTGGEPLLQWRVLSEMLGFVRRNVDCMISINTNMTLPKPLEYLVRRSLIDHIATDLKIPFKELTGVSIKRAVSLWTLYLESISIVGSSNVKFELRIPVPKGFKNYSVELTKALKSVLKKLEKCEWYVVINPLLGPPYTSPRNTYWCEKHCNPSKEELDYIIKIVSEAAGEYGGKVYMTASALYV